MTSRSYAAEGIVLKRVNVGEADRLVTLFTREEGKVVAVAKGARRLTSSRLSCLEPATQAHFYFAVGKSLDILTQAKLMNSFTRAHETLIRVTQTYQILEVVDLLTAERQENAEVYQILLETLTTLETDGHLKAYLVEQTRLILKALGFTYDKPFTDMKLKEYIEELTNKKLRSKAYLSIIDRISSKKA